MGIKLDTSAGAAQHDSLREANIRKQFHIVEGITAAVFGILIVISLIGIIKSASYISKYESVLDGVVQEYNALIASKQTVTSDGSVSENAPEKTELVVEVSTAVDAGNRVAELRNCLYDDAHKGVWTDAEKAEYDSYVSDANANWIYNKVAVDTNYWIFKTPFGVDPSQTGNKLYGVVWECWANSGSNTYLAGVMTANYDFTTNSFSGFECIMTDFGKMFMENGQIEKTTDEGTSEEVQEILDLSDQLMELDQNESATDTDADATTEN